MTTPEEKTQKSLAVSPVLEAKSPSFLSSSLTTPGSAPPSRDPAGGTAKLIFNQEFLFDCVMDVVRSEGVEGDKRSPRERWAWLAECDLVSRLYHFALNRGLPARNIRTSACSKATLQRANTDLYVKLDGQEEEFIEVVYARPSGDGQKASAQNINGDLLWLLNGWHRHVVLFSAYDRNSSMVLSDALQTKRVEPVELFEEIVLGYQGGVSVYSSPPCYRHQTHYKEMSHKGFRLERVVCEKWDSLLSAIIWSAINPGSRSEDYVKKRELAAREEVRRNPHF